MTKKFLFAGLIAWYGYVFFTMASAFDSWFFTFLGILFWLVAPLPLFDKFHDVWNAFWKKTPKNEEQKTEEQK